MLHLGDITMLNGHDIPPVDVVTGGSPCQDLSVAGRRAGLDGERSGLFLEQCRLVREMRERDVSERLRSGRTDEPVRPRYMVWENVRGAFSSNGGRDFQRVLTEIVRIAEPESPDVPLPEGGRWPKAGCLCSEMGTWSVAWRLHDAQYWGVPQRRKRIALVADFGGNSAAEILFECEGMPGNPESSREEKSDIAGVVADGPGGTSGDVKPMAFVKGTRPHNSHEGQIWKNGEVANTLNTFDIGETRCNELVTCRDLNDIGIYER